MAMARSDPRAGAEHEVEDVEEIVDLRMVPVPDFWERISDAIHRAERRTERPWRLQVLLPDSALVATELPHLLAYLQQQDVAHEVSRGPGGGQILLLRGAA
jgi:hypothetical protein